ncbi:MAG: hypothetical protein CMQ34_01485 [Gammaproteobacteria bacterium]|nr:hypothetical protein [Gammaproteobacteria bacterium]
MIKTLFKKRSLLLSLLMLAVIVMAIQVSIERRYLEQVEAVQSEAVSERLSTIRYQLESELTNNLSLINGLAAFIASYPDFTAAQFELYASTVLAREPALVNLAVAPGLVIRDIYPYEGNEAAIGLDYMRQDNQRAEVVQVVQTGSLVIAGPLELVQGGVAFIGRAPVYVLDETGEPVLWGIVSAPILAETVYDNAGLLDLPADLAFAMRRAGRSGTGDVFFGVPATFDNPLAVIMPISAGGSTWEIAAAPPPALLQGGTAVVVLRAGSILVFVLLAVLLALRHRQFENNQALKNIIFRNERFLRAVETVSQVGGWRWSDDRFTELSTQTRDIMMLPRNDDTVDMTGFCVSLDTRSAEMLTHYITQAVKLRQRIDQELELRRREGRIIWVHLKADVAELDGDRVELIGAIQDITQQKKVDQLIEYQANYDSLTGLPNRSLFQDRLYTALLHAQRRSTRIAVLFVDLDNFKSVNDNLGHDAGDELLVESAQRIQAAIRTEDTVARYSGDEFVALLVDVFAASVVSRIADDIVAAMRQPFVLDGRQVYCSVSIGVAFYPDDGESVDTLVIKADQAMYEVKKAGRNSWQFYTTAMQLESEQKHHLYNELVVALELGQLSVVYQPIVEAASGRVVSCEALVRWPLEDGGWIAPDIFIPIAEERGLINRIDLFVLLTALRFLNELNATLREPIALSVNVSPRVLHLRDDDAQDWLRALEREKQVNVTIEITERVLVEDSSSTHEVLDQLHRAGVQIAIDDFGTGYSGLSYFSRFPVSSVKIDRSFVQDLGLRTTETTLVETILLLASKLNIKVVAEGVETESQAAFLRDNQCDYLQGYHISRPLAGQDFRDFVMSRD